MTNNFLDKSPKPHETKANIDKCDYTKPRNFCTAKEAIDSEETPTEWEKNENYASEKGFISHMHKEFNNNKNPIKNKHVVLIETSQKKKFK
jgi:hypothetical protein